jgi:hypothetical protein
MRELIVDPIVVHSTERFAASGIHMSLTEVTTDIVYDA